MDDDLDYHLDEDEPKNSLAQKKKCSKTMFIIRLVIAIIVIIAIFFLVYFFLVYKSKDYEEDYYIFYNLTTSENGKIINSFKKGEINYNENIGDINNGEDYDENERNNVDLCIPKNITKKKNKYNKVYLQLHGGGWVEGSKENISLFCQINEPFDVITATMSYTLLNGTYSQSNIFRILDEVTASIKKIKSKLKEEGFNVTKLELAIHGSSAGAHISLLYSYLVKNHPLPLKFIFDNVGPISISPYDFWIIPNENETLSSIEPDSIEKAKKNKTIIYLNGNGESYMPHFILLHFMNIFLGRKFNDNFDDMYNKDKNEINYESDKFKQLLDKVKYAFPSKYVTKDSPPVLCLYGGNDIGIGVAQYAKLKQAYIDADIIDKIELIYFRYGGHGLDDKTLDGREKMGLISIKKKEMINKYFHKDD